jgi:uncharacterized protein (DUF1697 family)
VIYVALLRGINVGGKSTVDMKQLKAVFEDAGMTSVTTYINSGNVVFSSRARNRTKLAARLEEAIAERFGFHVRVLVRDLAGMRLVMDALPSDWVNDQAIRCEVMFLWDTVDFPGVVDDLTIKPAIDDVRHVPGAVIWKVDRSNVNRSGMVKLIGTPLYRQMTMRSCNTTRKLLELMEATAGR